MNVTLIEPYWLFANVISKILLFDRLHITVLGALTVPTMVTASLYPVRVGAKCVKLAVVKIVLIVLVATFEVAVQLWVASFHSRNAGLLPGPR